MLTPLEEEALEALAMALNNLAIGRVPRHEHMDMMSALITIHRKIQNKKDGCPTGKHTGHTVSCHCPKEPL